VAQHSYSVGPFYVTEADGAIRVRQESSDNVLATMDDGGHPDLELVPYAEQLANARLFAAASDLLTACIWAEAAIAPFSKSPTEKSGISMLRAAIANATGAS
jgi:hypothetical protein